MKTACPLCQSNDPNIYATAQDVEYLTGNDTYTYLKCLGCDILYLDGFQRLDLNKIYPQTYYSFGVKKKSFVKQVKSYLDQRFLRPFLEGASLTTLDVGGGNGELADKIKRIEPATLTHIVDISDDAGGIARLNGHTYHTSRYEDFRTDVKFDLVTMFNLIEHVGNPREVLVKTRELLKKDGLLIIQTPNFYSLDSYLFRNKSWTGLHCPRHWILFSKKSLTDLLQGQNFRLKEFKYIQGAPFWSGSLASYILAKLRIKRTSPINQTILYKLFIPFFAALDLILSRFTPTSQMLVVAQKIGK